MVEITPEEVAKVFKLPNSGVSVKSIQDDSTKSIESCLLPTRPAEDASVSEWD